MQKKEEKKETKSQKNAEYRRSENKKSKYTKEEKKNEKSPDPQSYKLDLMKKDTLGQSLKQLRKNQTSPSPVKTLILPVINTNSRISTLPVKENVQKNEASQLNLHTNIKENTVNKNVVKNNPPLAPIEEIIKRKKSVTANKRLISNNQNKSLALLNNNKNNNTINVSPSKNIKVVQDVKPAIIVQSPQKEKISLQEKLKKMNTNSVSPLRAVKMESPTEDENDRIAKVRKLYKEKKLHNFDKSKNFFYVIFPGNNSALIKKCMQHRANWKECQNPVTTLYNFKWQQNCIGLDFSSLNKVPSIKQICNHYEFHPQISNKMNLFINMVKYCEDKGLDVFKYIPFTIIMQYDSSNYQSQLTSFSDFFNNIKDYVISSDKSDSKYKKYSSLFKIDQFDRMGSKTNVYIHPNHYNGKNYWLVKATDMNRGRCIKIGDSIPKIQKLIKKFYDGIYKEFKECEEDESIIEEEKNSSSRSNIKIVVNKQYKNEKNNKEDEEKKDKKKHDTFKKYRTSYIILQKYIEKPLLYWKRKFDIRMWVMITHKFEVYAYRYLIDKNREGHLKTSSEEYNVNLKDSYVHLTNYSVQKYNNNFSKFEYGNEVSFSDFQNYINHDYSSKNFNVRTNLLEKMKDLITISMKSVADKINPNNRKFCFEIFGYDFIMDCDFNLYLLEVNTNPGLEESSPLINKILPRMIDDALRLTVDDLFETRYTWEDLTTLNDKSKESNNKERDYKSPYPVEGYSDSENIFCFVCNLTPEPEQKKRNK